MGKNNGLVIGAAIVIVVILAALAVSVLGGGKAAPATTAVPGTTTVSGTGYSSQKASVPVMITDPAQVPVGTSALVFGYSNVQVNATNATGSTWVNATGTGSVNLIAIQNSAQVMAYANVAANSSISQIKLLVNWVNITVNGTTYPVPVSNPQLTLSITGSTGVGQGSGVLIDYTPTVSPAFSGNSTVFVRVPAGKAVITSGVNSSFSTNVGATAPLWVSAAASIAAQSPNITITAATLAAKGNSTWLSVTVKNSANRSVTLNNIVLYGMQNVSAHSAAGAGVNSSVAAGLNNLLYGRANAVVNARALVEVAVNLRTYGMQNFAINSNGTMVQVTSLASAQTSGATIAPGASATLVYNSTASYNSGTFQTTPTVGSQYRIAVSGRAGVSAGTMVTAS
ncbi:MAG: hypothetical protein KGH66_03360 [Candidatus Micrarchaeota archaeon]|nr:hypothetical protein [Candidatus Micrarchaeota archaeon]